jgi:PAS domain S-box-containing protein
MESSTANNIELIFGNKQKRYRSLIDNLKDIVFHVDNEGKIIFLNKAWERILGYTVEESLGEHFDRFIYADDSLIAQNIFENLLKHEGEYVPHQFRAITKAGVVRWVEVFAWISQDNKNKRIGIFGSVTDITEQKHIKELEAELLQVSIKLTATPGIEIPSAFNFALSRIGKFFGADRSYIFEFSSDYKTMSNTYEWCNEGVEPQIHILQQIPCDTIPMWMETLQSNREIVISSVVELDDRWKIERLTMKGLGIRAVLIIPIFAEKVLIAFLGLDYVQSSKKFSASEINILKVWGNMFTGIILNQRKEILLNQTQRNFESFFRANNDFLFVFNAEGKIVEINEIVKKRLNYSSEDLIGQPIESVYPKERQQEAKKVVYKMYVGLIDKHTMPLVSKSGEMIPVETVVKHGFWNDTPAYFAISRDISGILLSEEKFSKAFQSNTVLMGIINMETDRFIDVNDTMIKKTGYEREEVVGKTVPELNLFRNLQKFDVDFEYVKNSLPFKEIEADLVKKDGSVMVGLFSADSIYVGKDQCLLITMIDITRRKEAENELVRARKEAEEANRSKSEFLSRMSHELRTPMNSILGFAQLLEMNNDLPDSQRKGVKHIMNNGRHLLKLINEVLDMARIESGKISMSIENIQIQETIKEAVDIIKPLMKEKNISLKLLEDLSETVFVKADKQRLIQVLVNLLSNAVKYNKPNGSIILNFFINPANKDFIRITIKDTGVGIEDANISRLFIPFERIETEDFSPEGTGLGLPIALELMHIMNGNIGVKSQYGVGSTFWVDIPLAEHQSRDMVNQDTAVSVLSDPVERVATILYIEDNLSNTDLIKQVMSNLRPNIKLVCDMHGKKTISLAKQHKPDLILLDLNLPDIHGSEVLGELKNDAETAHIPVVVLTADATQSQMKKLMQTGARAYLTKPVDLVNLLIEIDKF